MNLVKVSLPGKCERYCASMAEGRAYRDIFVNEFDVKKKDVKIEPATILTSKPDIIALLNSLLARIDEVKR